MIPTIEYTHDLLCKVVNRIFGKKEISQNVPQTPIYATAHLFSHVGNSRELQEDNFLLSDGEMLSPSERIRISRERQCLYLRKDIDKKHFVVAVSDGMGGHDCGEIASLVTTQLLYRRFSDKAELFDSDIVKEKIRLLNDDFRSYAKSCDAYRNMGATLCGAMFDGDNTLVFNVGDSRAYHFSSGTLSRITVDHTEGQRMLDLGFVTQDELTRLSRRKALYSYIGYDLPVIDIFSLSPREGDVLLFCTDGLTDALSDERIAFFLKESKHTVEKRGRMMLEEALKGLERRGDNITFIMIEL